MNATHAYASEYSRAYACVCVCVVVVVTGCLSIGAFAATVPASRHRIRQVVGIVSLAIAGISSADRRICPHPAHNYNNTVEIGLLAASVRCDV